MPGVPNSPRRGWLLLRYGARILEGTSDDATDVDLQAAAKRYAERYNRALLKYIDGQ